MGRKWGKRAGFAAPGPGKINRQAVRAVSSQPGSIQAFRRTDDVGRVTGIAPSSKGEVQGAPVVALLVVEYRDLIIGVKLNQDQAHQYAWELLDIVDPPQQVAATLSEV